MFFSLSVMLLFFIPFSFSTPCYKGQLSDCYDVTVFNQPIPPEPITDGECLGNETSLLYSTAVVNEGMEIIISFGAAVLKLTGRNTSLDEYCSSDIAKSKYNISMFVQKDVRANVSYYEKALHGIHSLPNAYTSVSDIQNIFKDIGNYHFISSVVAPTRPVTYYVLIRRNHPINEDYCVVNIVLYSCWVKYLIFKIVGAVIGGIFGIFVVLCLPFVFLAMCVVHCNRKKDVDQ